LQKMDFDVLALRFTPKFAYQREGPAVDREVSAIVFDAPHLVDCLFVEGCFAFHVGPICAQQSKSAVITKHLRMHAG